MAPKKKSQKMALSDFFADSATSGSWADDMDFPSAPAARENAGPKRGEPGYLDSMPDRSARSSNFAGAPEPRAELPLPEVPPFTAFIGNLSFEPDVDEAVREFFADLEPVSVRILKDNTGKIKGFGYVEFPSQDTLKEALGRSNSQLQGRSIRVNVAEAPSRREGFTASAAEESSQWRRATPLPSRATEAPGPRRTSSFSPTEPGPERDWSSARGARFTPAPPAPVGGPIRRDSSGAGRVRDMAPSHADETDKWRSNKPMAEAKTSGRDVPPHQRGGAPDFEQSSPGLADTESTWTRASKLKAPVVEPPTRSSTTSPGGEERDWRSARATPAASQPGSTDGESPRPSPAAPIERRKLQLAPRSVPATPSTAGSTDNEAPPASGRASIFGAAKPIDSASHDAAAAAKLAQRDEERKKAKEAEIVKQKEEAEKAKQFGEEKLKAIKAAQEKAQAEVSGVKSKPQSSPQTQSQRSYPPKEQNQSQQQAKRVHPSRKPSNEPTRDDDGFEAVQGRKGSAAAGASANQNQDSKSRKDSSTRPAFSFAAAARAENAFVEGQNDEAVEEATKGVEGVKV